MFHSAVQGEVLTGLFKNIKFIVKICFLLKEMRARPTKYLDLAWIDSNKSIMRIKFIKQLGKCKH